MIREGPSTGAERTRLQYLANFDLRKIVLTLTTTVWNDNPETLPDKAGSADLAPQAQRSMQVVFNCLRCPVIADEARVPNRPENGQEDRRAERNDTIQQRKDDNAIGMVSSGILRGLKGNEDLLVYQNSEAMTFDRHFGNILVTPEYRTNHYGNQPESSDVYFEPILAHPFSQQVYPQVAAIIAPTPGHRRRQQSKEQVMTEPYENSRSHPQASVAVGYGVGTTQDR
ncbi:MAG: hypothetical protein M1816_001006 [Peltula sp. TS41687]|nr:MAG: hypothetical protein M1816_001006 [Peltula sp. TS41687]